MSQLRFRLQEHFETTENILKELSVTHLYKAEIFQFLPDSFIPNNSYLINNSTLNISTHKSKNLINMEQNNYDEERIRKITNASYKISTI